MQLRLHQKKRLREGRRRAADAICGGLAVAILYTKLVRVEKDGIGENPDQWQ